jgi:hypothetical protein
MQLHVRPGGINSNKCNFVHDPSSNGLKTENGALPDEDNFTSSHISSDSTSCPTDISSGLNRDCDKIIAMTLNVESVHEPIHTDCPISEANPSRSSTKLPAFLYLNEERTSMAWLPLSSQHLVDSLNFDCM